MTFKALLFAFLFTIFLSVPLHASNSIDVNTATAKELTELTGIGKKIAAKIIQYRKDHGMFKSIDDLAKVSGISSKTVEKNRSKLTASEEKGK